jgi:hypothetical protein
LWHLALTIDLVKPGVCFNENVLYTNLEDPELESLIGRAEAIIDAHLSSYGKK